MKGVRVRRYKSIVGVVNYVVSYARKAGLSAAPFEDKGGYVVVLSTPDHIGSARLYIELDSATLLLGEYQYFERIDIDLTQPRDEGDLEIYEILVVAAKNWLNGQYRGVELRGCFGRSSTGIRIDFEDGDYIELPKGSGRLLRVKHKWFWGKY